MKNLHGVVANSYKVANYVELLKETASDGFDVVFDFTNQTSFYKDTGLFNKTI